MSDQQTPLTDEQARCLQAIATLEQGRERPVTLEEIADELGTGRTETRGVLSGLLSDGADVVRELEAPEPDETAYTVKTKT